jgi:hypothetical protein
MVEFDCPNGFYGSAFVNYAGPANQETIDWVCARAVPAPTTPTTAGPLRITSINPGSGRGTGSAGPWQQASCTFTWGLQLSDGRLIWRTRTQPMNESGTWSTTITTDAEFGVYPYGHRLEMSAFIQDGMANWLFC